MAPQNAYNRMARDSSTEKVGTGKNFIPSDALIKSPRQPIVKVEPSQNSARKENLPMNFEDALDNFMSQGSQR